MKKFLERFLAIIITVVTTFLLTVPAFAEGSNIEVDASSALLIEVSSGDILYEKNSNKQFAPASVTKIMTMLLTMEAIDSNKISLNDKVTISENSKKMGGSSMILDTGEIRTVEDLLKGVGIASGNDAAVALGEYLGGTEGSFVDMMNKRAKELGMTNTIFKNCTGLPIDGHLSTAYDISLMSRELLKHSTILKYTGTYMETISEGRKTPIELVNHNKLVRFFKGCDGLKTGFTNEAKYCISATATNQGTRMLAVIMGAPSFKVRNRDASMLMNYGFSKYETIKSVAKDDVVDKVQLDKKGKKVIILKAKEDIFITVPKAKKADVEATIQMKNENKDIKKGDIVATYEFSLDGKKISSVDLYSDNDCKKIGFLQSLKDKIGI